MTTLPPPNKMKLIGPKAMISQSDSFLLGVSVGAEKQGVEISAALEMMGQESLPDKQILNRVLKGGREKPC